MENVNSSKMTYLSLNTELCQMKVVIAAATELEMIPFKQFVGEKNGATIEFCLTGVGAIATTYHLEKYISQFQPKLIIQVGIAGAFVNTHQLGTAVAIEEELVSDMGVFESDGYKKDLSRT